MGFGGGGVSKGAGLEILYICMGGFDSMIQLRSIWQHVQL